MKRVISLALVSLLVASSLSGCGKTKSIIGRWQDSEGYKVEFMSDGTFIEDTYGTALTYTYDGTRLLYTWADGYSRASPVTFSDDNAMSLQLNGKLRLFHQSETSPETSLWLTGELSDVTATLTGKLDLLGNTGVQSSIRLLASNQFSLSWKKGSTLNTNWVSNSDNCRLGLYADRGAGESLVLYTHDDVNTMQYEEFKESPSGKYVATMKLGSNMTTIAEDWSSPVKQRGYVVQGQIVNEDSGVTYIFKRDNTMTKQLVDGLTVTYAYFIDSDGLVTLSCLDGDISTDCMWLDVKTGNLYRMVYERDSWVSYMYAVALADEETTIEENTPTDSTSYIVDDELVIRSDAVSDGDLSSLLGGHGSVLNDLYSLVNSSDEEKTLEDYNSIQELHSTLEYERLSKEERELQLQKEKEEFLAQMGVLAEQLKIEEEKAEAEMRAQFEAEGYIFDEETGSWILPGVTNLEEFGISNPREVPIIESPGESIVIPGFVEDVPHSTQPTPPDVTVDSDPSTEEDSNTGGQVEVEEDEKPVEKPVDTTVAKVTFYCNCETCHTRDMPISRGTSNVGLVDSTVWTPGIKVLIGDTQNAPQVTLVDSQGLVKGDNIHVYFADHNWVQAQKNGTYSIVKIDG